MLSKAASRTIFWGFGTELQSPRPMVNTQLIRPTAWFYSFIYIPSYIWHLKDMNISPTITWEILKLAPAYNKTSKKCLLCLHKKLAIITYPSQNTLLNKKNKKKKKKTLKFPNAITKTNISHTWPIPHNPCNLYSLKKKKKKKKKKTYTHKWHHITPHLKHCKYHFPPPSITPAIMYVPPPSINPEIHFPCWHYVSMSISNRPQHRTFILSTTYTPFITIT